MKGLVMPELPSEEVVKAHNLAGCVPYCSWCVHCVRGCAVDKYHRRGNGGEDRRADGVSIDYMHLARKKKMKWLGTKLLEPLKNLVIK